jgi:hypothetical protein
MCRVYRALCRWNSSPLVSEWNRSASGPHHIAYTHVHKDGGGRPADV